MTTSRERAVVAARTADAKSATDILVLDVGPVLGITEYFVIAGASNPRLSKSVAEDVERAIAELDGSRPLRVEGLDDRQWILTDYGDFVVHIFVNETREYYELERLWGDADVIDWQEQPLRKAE